MHAGYIVVFMAKHEFDADKQQAYEQRFDVRLSCLRPRPYREDGFVIFDNSRIVVRKHSSLVRSLAIHYADCGDCVPYCGIGGCKSQDKATPKVSVYHIAYSDRDVTAVVVESMDAQLDSKINIEGACDCWTLSRIQVLLAAAICNIITVTFSTCADAALTAWFALIAFDLTNPAWERV
jgi:hypothetical protein